MIELEAVSMAARGSLAAAVVAYGGHIWWTAACGREMGDKITRGGKSDRARRVTEEEEEEEEVVENPGFVADCRAFAAIRHVSARKIYFATRGRTR